MKSVRRKTRRSKQFKRTRHIRTKRGGGPLTSLDVARNQLAAKEAAKQAYINLLKLRQVNLHDLVKGSRECVGGFCADTQPNALKLSNALQRLILARTKNDGVIPPLSPDEKNDPRNEFDTLVDEQPAKTIAYAEEALLNTRNRWSNIQDVNADRVRTWQCDNVFNLAWPRIANNCGGGALTELELKMMSEWVSKEEKLLKEREIDGNARSTYLTGLGDRKDVLERGAKASSSANAGFDAWKARAAEARAAEAEKEAAAAARRLQQQPDTTSSGPSWRGGARGRTQAT